MTRFQITSTAGADFGIYEGRDEAEALAALHREAGYDVTYEAGEIRFPDDETAKLCGGVSDWCFDRVGA